jgi:peroxiredoxin
MRKTLVAIMISLITVAGPGPSVSAQSAGSPQPAAANQSRAADNAPKPTELLRAMADYLGTLPAFSCRIELAASIQAAGIDNSLTTKMNVRVERPNRMAYLLEEGVMGMNVVSDGKQIIQHVPSLNRYTIQDAPADLADSSIENTAMVTPMLGIPAGIILASGEKLYKLLTDGVTESQYLGIANVGDARCHHCRFVQENFSWDIWIDSGARPLVRKVVPDLSKQLAQAGGMMKDAKIEYLITFSDWDVAPEFTEADFAYTPPASAEKVDSLFAGLGGRQAQGPHPLVGQPAPQFTTVNLKEEPIDLAAHVGKDIVMLDFWATWCGPCVQAMPEVVGVAKKFADRGVVFYAVNVQEDAETINEFLKTNELEVPVAMDPDATITQQYRADGIPQTVLIGKDGKVQVVHVGFSPNLADELSTQIEELLAGKDLAAATLAEAEAASEDEATVPEQEEGQD